MMETQVMAILLLNEDEFLTINYLLELRKKR